jgi:hypothetical protein
MGRHSGRMVRILAVMAGSLTVGLRALRRDLASRRGH